MNYFTRLWKLRLSDFWRGFIVACLTIPIGILYDWATMEGYQLNWRSVVKGFIAGGLAYIMKNLVTGDGGKILTNKIIPWLMVPLFMLLPFLSGCSTIGATGPDAAAARGIAWYEDIQNWTQHQKANFLTDTWMSEKNGYDKLNAIPNKSPALIKLLQGKRLVLENSRIPLRLYASLVKAGGTPDQDIEQQIIDWIRQLQLQALQAGGK